MKTKKYKTEHGLMSIKQISKTFGLSYGCIVSRLDLGAFYDADFAPNRSTAKKYKVDGKKYTIKELSLSLNLSMSTVNNRLKVGVCKMADFSLNASALKARGFIEVKKSKKVKKYKKNTTLGDPMWKMWMKLLR